MIQRCFDFFISLVGLVILSPLFAVIAVLIRIQSGPPVFFRQSRTGKNGREFRLIKFRTMIISQGAERGEFVPGDTTRVTSIGRLLRKHKLDELPQLMNVLRGEMSLVGPRPEVRKWVEAYPERWAAVLKVRPGLTDPASVIYSQEEQLLANTREPERIYREIILPHKLSLYEKYIREKNIFVDFSIILKTIFSVLRP